MIRWVLTLCLIFFQEKLSAQTEARFLLDLDQTSSTEKIPIPFSAIKVIDARFDKSNVGCIVREPTFKAISKFKELAILPDSLSAYLPKILHRLLDVQPEAKDTLVILVKEFRITDHLFNDVSWNYEPSTLLRFSLSFYSLQQENFQRLFSLNDVYSQRWKESHKNASKKMIPGFRSEAISLMLARLFENRSWIVSGNAYSRQEVEDGLFKRYALPILTDSISHPGVYRNFSEFRDNRPSFTTARLVQEKGKTELRDEKGQKISLDNYWGYCDGKTSYIFFRNNLCELQSIDKSFRFVSHRFLQDLHRKPDLGSLTTSAGLIPAMLVSGNPKSMEYFYLNMDRGDVYLEEIFGRSGLKTLQKEILK
jgi:hypothetical protein